MYQNLRLNTKFCDCQINYTTKDNSNKQTLFANRYVLNKSNYFKQLFNDVDPEIIKIDKSIYHSYNIRFPLSEQSLLKNIDLLYGHDIENFNDLSDILDVLDGSLYLELDYDYIEKTLMILIIDDLCSEKIYDIVISICNSNITNRIKTNFLSRILYKLSEQQINYIKSTFCGIFPKIYYSDKTFAIHNKIVIAGSSSIQYNDIEYTTYSTIAYDDKTSHGIWLTAKPVDNISVEPIPSYKSISLALFKKLEEPIIRKIKSFESKKEYVKEDGKLQIPCPFKYSFSKERCRYGYIFYTCDDYDGDYDFQIIITDQNTCDM